VEASMLGVALSGMDRHTAVVKRKRVDLAKMYGGMQAEW
jgi:hypothetical protein